MESRTTEKFRRLFSAAPASAQAKARGAYLLWSANPAHPSLRFKKVHDQLPIYSRPGGNVTGLTTINIEVVPRRLEILKEMSGGKASRGAVLFNPADASNVLLLRATEDQPGA